MANPYLPYQQPPPQPRANRSILSWLPAALTAVVGLAGLLCTLLPMWTVPVEPSDFQSDLQQELDGIDPELMMDGVIDIHVGFYDWLISTTPVVFVIPLALAVAVAVAVTQLVRGSDRGLWGGTGALVTVALLLALAVLVQPSAKVAVTGELADQLSERDLNQFDQTSQFDVGYGLGLILAVVALVVVLGLSAWQYFATGRPAKPQPQPWAPPVGAPAPYGY